MQEAMDKDQKGGEAGSGARAGAWARVNPNGSKVTRIRNRAARGSWEVKLQGTGCLRA